MFNRKFIIIFAVTTLTCGYFIKAHDRQSPIQNNLITSQTNKEQHATAINEKIYLQSSSPLLHNPLPASLADIGHDITLQVDEHGNLMVNPDTHDLFEFYLSAMGEESLEQVLIRIRHDIDKQLTGAAKDQAFLLLKNFVDYKIELSALATDLKPVTDRSSSQLESLKLQKANVASLRARFFSASTYDVFFQQAERYDDFMLAQLEINQNQELNTFEKKQRLDALLDGLPEEIKRVRQSVSRHGELFKTAQDMRNDGASNEDIYQLRARSLGNQAATALAALDVKRNLWQQRLSHYAQHRNAILGSGLSDTDSQQAIDALINQNFTLPESVRVKALNHSL